MPNREIMEGRLREKFDGKPVLLRYSFGPIDLNSIPCKTIKDMVAYLKKKYPAKFGEKTDQAIKDKITENFWQEKSLQR